MVSDVPPGVKPVTILMVFKGCGLCKGLAGNAAQQGSSASGLDDLAAGHGHGSLLLKWLQSENRISIHQYVLSVLGAGAGVPLYSAASAAVWRISRLVSRPTATKVAPSAR